MIDSHCHLTAAEFSADREDVIDRAIVAGVEQMICVADFIDDIQMCRSIAEAHSQIFFTAGAHPHHAKDFDAARDLAIIREAAAHPKCKAIGEIGLDYHYMQSPKEVQRSVFEAQLLLAKELDLPAVVHCREAVEDVWEIVSRVQPRRLVLHCCSEKFEDVERFVAAGFFLSFTGIVTYPKSAVIRNTVSRCPLHQLMVETDAPFLAPVPYRGKRCEPALVMDVAQAVADIKGLTLPDIDVLTTRNTVEFFSLT